MIHDKNILDDATNVTPRATRLANVILMTERMLSLAKDNQWDSVTELEEERRLELQDCFSEPIPESQSTLFSEALAAMLHMNEELISILESAKAEVAIKRTDQRRTSASVRHYLDIEKEH
jgi:hypothetical protein